MSTRPTGRMNWLGAMLLAASAIGALATPALAKDPVPTDRLLPPGTQAYVTIPNAPEMAKRWNGSLLGRLWEDKEMADFRKEVEEVVAEKSEELKEKLGVTFADLAALPSGEVSFALVQLPGKKPSMVGFLNYGENEKTVTKLLDAAEAALEKRKAKHKETEVEETKVHVYTLEEEKDEDADDADEDDAGAEDADADEDKEPQQVAYFVRDSWLVVGSDLPVLEAVLARWDGEHEKTFAENETYRYIADRTKGDAANAMMTWYVDPIGIATNAVQASGNIQAAVALGLLPTLGVSKFKAMGGSLDMSTSEYDQVSRTLMYVEQPTSGLLDVFHFPPAALSPSKWVPANASNWYAMNWDVAGAYEAIEQTVDSFQGPGTFSKLVDKMAATEEGPKIHLKKDFIDLLDGKVEVFSAPPVKEADDDEAPAIDRFLMALGVKDKAKMEGVLAKLAKTPGFPGKSREFKGTTIYEIPTGLGGSETGMGISVADGNLLFASDSTLIEQLLRNDSDQESLADTAEYKRVAAKFPAKTSIAGFQKQDAQMKTFYDLLKSGQGAELTDEVDFTTLPSFDVIRKYLTPTGSYAEPDKNGVLFISFSLKAAK